MTLETGTRVSDSVTLVRPLGRGGMGSVWVARHDKLDTDVAVKFVSAELAKKDPTVLTRFKREAALSAKIKSPHVVKTFDHGVMDDGRPYLVMELLQGETLGEYLTRHDCLSPRHAVTVVAQIAAVLDEAHELGVVHRDIKPDNVFLIDAGYDLFAKVLDFGIAKQTSVPKVSEVTSTGAIVGTPEYMSPEQLLSTRSADHRSDLWSLAVLTYHALIGRVPFTGETLPSLSLSICNADYDPPSELSKLPGDLDGWFARAFQIDPNDRFQSAGSMADELRRILLGSERPAESRPRPGSGRDADVISDPDADPQADTLERRDSDVLPTRLKPATAVSAIEPKSEGITLAEGTSPKLRAPGSPSISGSATELAGLPSSAPSKGGPRRSALPVAGLLFVAIAIAVTGNALLRRSLPAARGGSSSAPFRSAGDPWDEDEPSAVRPEPVRSASPPASPAANTSAASEPTEPSAPRIEKPRSPSAWGASTPKTSASPATKVKPGCENPFQLDADGDLEFKPGCR